MSLITHRCTNCGHPDFRRLAKTQGKEICDDAGCGCRCIPGAPELVPTYGLDGQPVEKIVAPGAKTGFGVATHDCKACKALYAELTGAAA